MAVILLVEDKASNARLARFLLERRGHRVLEAPTSETAIEAARSCVPDLILLDIHLPLVDGLEATRRLKADPRTASIPVVALTALAMKGDQERILAAGCDGYIAKPIRHGAFIESVDRALGRKDG